LHRAVTFVLLENGPKFQPIGSYLTRHIYADQKSGDRINGWTKIWGFFKEIPKFRTPN